MEWDVESVSRKFRGTYTYLSTKKGDRQLVHVIEVTRDDDGYCYIHAKGLEDGATQTHYVKTSNTGVRPGREEVVLEYYRPEPAYASTQGSAVLYSKKPHRNFQAGVCASNWHGLWSRPKPIKDLIIGGVEYPEKVNDDVVILTRQLLLNNSTLYYLGTAIGLKKGKNTLLVHSKAMKTVLQGLLPKWTLEVSAKSGQA